ncbi:MAG: hypothetical protein ABJE10_15325 [bacterium]
MERVRLKATAIVAALLLWLIVKARQPVQDYVAVIVMPTLDSSLVLLETPPQLKALVSGRAVDIVKLHVDLPSIHRIIDGDVPDTLVLDVAPGEVRVPAELANEIHVLDLQPRSVTLRFGMRATRRVPVTSSGRVIVKQSGNLRAADSVEFDPRMVRITGPRRLVRRIETVHPYSLMIDDGDTLQHVADLDTGKLGIRVLPSQVKVRVHGERATVARAKP